MSNAAEEMSYQMDTPTTAPAPAPHLAEVPKPATSKDYFYVENLNAYYGDSYIVQNVSFEVNEGEIVALLGRNGAGKTSTLRAIARADEPELRSGTIKLLGEDVHSMRSHDASNAGIALVPEDRRIIPGLTVEENLDLAVIAGNRGWEYERIYDLFPRLKERRKQEGVTLSGGEQQMLAIGRALAKELKLLLLDEPYEGLAPVVRHDIEKALLEVRAAGITTIIVEQNAVAALKISDRAIILDTGEVAFQGSAKEVLDDEALRHEYLAI
ncbi:MAG: ABC transporter ATP-binding protein [Pseudomonadota bacterium]